MQPKISIIIACFNSGKTIEQAIESVLHQTYTNIELVLVDGGSTDNTLAIITKYVEIFKQNNISYKWISEKDNGIYDAINKGIEIATGEYIAVLGSDDWYDKDGLANIIGYCDENNILPDLMITPVKCYTNDELSSIEQVYSPLIKQKSIQHQGVLYKKELHKRFGLYSLEYKLASDYDFLLKCYLSGATFYSTTIIFANFRVSGASAKLHYMGAREQAIIRYKYNIISRKKYYLLLLKSFITKYTKKMGI